MGLDGLQFDAVKKFNASMEQSNKEMRQQMEAKNITVPIVAQQPKDLDKGLTVQANPDDKKRDDLTKVVINATNDGVDGTAPKDDEAPKNDEVAKDDAAPKNDATVQADDANAAAAEAAAQRAKNQEAAEARKEITIDTKPADYPQVERIKTDTRDILPPKLTDDKKDEIKAAAKKGYIENLGYSEKEAEDAAEVWKKNEEYRVEFERREVFLTKNEKNAFKKTDTQRYDTDHIHNDEAYNYLRNNGYTTSDQIKTFALNDIANATRTDGETTYYASDADVKAAAAKFGISEDAARDICHRSGIKFWNAPRRKVTGTIAGGAATALTAIAGNYLVNQVFHKDIRVSGGKEVSSGSHSSSNSNANANTNSSGAGATGYGEAAAGASVKRGGTRIRISGDQIAEMGVGILSGAIGKYVYDKITTPTDEKVVINPFKKTVQRGKVGNLNLHLDVPELNLKPTVTLPVVKPCPEDEWFDDGCDVKVKSGSSWSYYAEKSVKVNGEKITGTKYEEPYLYAQQLMYKVSNPKGLDENRFLPIGEKYHEYTDFGRLFADEEIMQKYPQLNLLKDAEIELDCNALKNDGVKTTRKAKPKRRKTGKKVARRPRRNVKGRKTNKFRYGGHITNNPYKPTRFTQSCNDNVPVPHYD